MPARSSRAPSWRRTRLRSPVRRRPSLASIGRPRRRPVRHPPARRTPSRQAEGAGQAGRDAGRQRRPHPDFARCRARGQGARTEDSTARNTRPSAALDRLNAWIARARDVGVVAIDTETTSLDPMQAHFCGFSLAVADNEACYVPIGHREGGTKGGGDLFAPDPQLCPGQISEQAALAAIKPLLEDPGVLKIGQNMKYDWLIFAQRGIDVRPMRRHHADVLRARRRPRRPRHGRAVGSRARPHADHVRAGRRLRQVAGAVRLRDHREGHRIRRRGRRRDAAAVARAEAAAAGASRSRPSTRRWSGRWCRCWRAWSGAASRSTARCCRGCPASSRRSRARWRTRSTSSPARRSIRAARSSSATSCSARWACRAAPRPRPGNGRPARKRARGTRRAGPRAAAEDPRLAAGVEAALDLHRRAAGLRQPGHPPRPHQLRAGRDHHRAAVVVRAEPAEHPDPHRGRPQDPPRLRRRRRAASWCPPTIRRSSCGCSPRSPTCRRCARRSATASTFTP